MGHHKHSAEPALLQTRRSVRDVACPTCGAAAGEHCFTARKNFTYIRTASHQARWNLFRKSRDKVDTSEFAMKVLEKADGHAANSNFMLNGWDRAKAVCYIKAIVEVLLEEGFIKPSKD